MARVVTSAAFDVRVPAAAPAGASPPAQQPKALTTRFADFWLLGGASLFVWLVMVLLEGFRGSWAVDQHYRNLTVTAASLALIVNYPHFLLSYKLAYSRGPSFVLAHPWQLVVVPIGLLALFAAAYAWFDVRVETVPALVQAREALLPWGVNAQVISGPRVGDLMFTAGFTLMIFTIGWHYAKQVFGCMMVYAHFDGYPLARWQRTLTKWALLSIWGMNFVDQNVGGSWRTFLGFSYASLDLPDVALPLAEGVVFAGFAAVLYFVFYTNYRVTGRVPSATLVAPFLALYVWWLPQMRHADYYLLLVPLFHSLQYLAFVYKVEGTRLGGAPRRELRSTALVVGVVVAGWLAFELVPNTLDEALGTFDAWGMYFFLTAAMLFINIHHYFIDNVLWRFRDPQVRAYLLG